MSSPSNSVRALVLGFSLVTATVAAAAEQAAVSHPPPAQTRTSTGHPNVIIYLVDTLRRDHLGVYGYARETSPRLDAFARDSVRFADAYSSTSWTKPATASLLTGLNPVRHGAITRSDKLDPTVPLLGDYLRAAGYHTAAFSTNPHILPLWGFDRGFDQFYDIEAVAHTARADEVNEVVFRHLGKQPAEPFFLYIHTRDPHVPYDPPPPYDRKWQVGSGNEPGKRLARSLAAYDGEIAFNDHHFGVLLDHLKSLGLYDDTLIVFTSDHGEEFGEHGGRGHGQTLYEEVVQVPLLIKLAGGDRAGRVIQDRVSLIDVVPTILATLGLSSPPGLDGVDLGKSVRDGKDPSASNRPLFLDLNATTWAGSRDVADGVMLGPHKLVRVQEPQESILLFDLRDDPKEVRNLATSETQERDRLESSIEDYAAQTQRGIHLWLVNQPSAAPRSCAGQLRTAGRFVDLHTLQFEADDNARVASDQKTLSFEVVLGNRPNPTGEPPLEIVDQDQISIRSEPDDANIWVDAFACDGKTQPLFLGRQKRRVDGLPVEIEPQSESLRVGRMSALFEKSRELSIIADGGAYIGVVPARERDQVKVDPELAERLRALGYVP